MQNTELERAFQRVREGDRGAFDEIYNGLKKPVYTVLLRYVNVAEDAEDLTQELFLRLFRSPPAKEVDNLRAYIFASARNLALDKLRKKSALPENAAEQNADDTSVEDAVERMDIEAALARLPEAEREAVSLHIYAELTFREMAAITGTPMGTLLWRYNRAIGKMRGYLSGKI